MDIQNYISSGILETYILGLLTPAEAREVERNMREYPEIKAALTSIEDSLEQYAQLNGINPPPHLKPRILKHINSNSVSNSTAAMSKGSNAMLWTGLMGLLLALAAMYAFYLFTQNSELEEKVIATSSQIEELQIACDSVQIKTNELEERLKVLRNPFNQSIIMNGTENHPEAIAAVHWNKEDKINYLDIINLPTPPTDKQYQLWAIVDGKPVDMGVFETNITPGAFVEVPFIEAPQAFAVTLEDLGGKPQPNLEQLYVIGNVS